MSGIVLRRKIRWCRTMTAGGEVMEWIPVSERLPDHGGTVICRTADRRLEFGRVMTVSKCDAGEWSTTHHWRGYPDRHLDITHWCPLPEAPENFEATA